MDSSSVVKSLKRLSVLMVFSLVLLTAGLVKTSYAATIISDAPRGQNVELAFFEVFNAYPYHQYYYAPRYIYSAPGAYWPGHAYYYRGHCCHKRCAVNSCGAVRCVRSCN